MRRLRASGLLALMVATAAGALALELVLRLPGVPYNLQELRTTSTPVLGTAALSLVVALVMGMPPWLGLASRRHPLGPARLLAVTVAHVLAVTCLAIWLLPRESIHDLAGSPVLRWPGQLETVWRFAGLFTVFSASLSAGWLLAETPITGRRWRSNVASAGALAGIGFAFSYWTVVVKACTDNITELLARNAALSSWLALAAGLLALGLASAALNRVVTRSSSRWGLDCVIAALAGAGGGMCLWLALAPRIEKYGATFSALQFLLSPDRSNYLPDAELYPRFGILVAVLVAGLSLAGSLAIVLGPKREPRSDL